MLLDHKNFHLGCTLRRGLSAILTVLFKTINCFLPIQNLYDLKYETYKLNIPELKKQTYKTTNKSNTNKTCKYFVLQELIL